MLDVSRVQNVKIVFDEVTPNVFKTIVSCLAAHQEKLVRSVHEEMVQTSTVTFSQRFAFIYAKFFSIVVGILRSYV